MVALEVWYDPDSDEPTIVHTPEELDAVLDVLDSWPRPNTAQLLVAEDLTRAIFDVGIDPRHDRGVLFYSGRDVPDGVISHGTEIADPPPIYYYMNSDTEFPANAEIPLADVRKAAHEYLASGGAQPSGVTWQPWTA